MVLLICYIDISLVTVLVTLTSFLIHLYLIPVGVLMVGHTHEDVDQSFCLLSRYLHKNSAISMEGTKRMYLITKIPYSTQV